MKSSNVMSLLIISIVLLGFSDRIASKEVSTTRLKSTAGTGVAALLVDEATVLNPAAISFFNISSFYLQKASSTLTPDQQTGPLSNAEEDELLFIASDAKGTLDGSVSYARTNESDGKSTRLATSMSAPVGKKSALGFGYAMTNRKTLTNPGKINQISAGVTHAINSNFTLGVVVPDLLGENELDRRAIVGAQFVYQDLLSLMIDAGADWEREAKESSLIRAAIQLKLFSDFYARFGATEDRGLKRKGTGAGLGWVQPRLVIDLAMTRTEFDEIASIGQRSETAKETSFALSYRF